MKAYIKISPPNSLIFVSDIDGGNMPEIRRGPRIWSTPTCVAVGCRAFMDGETAVALGAAHEVDPGTRPRFDDILETPSRVVVVSTVEHDVLLRAPALGLKTRLRIWTNHASEPDRIAIGIG